MRVNPPKKIVLLVTNDGALESTVRRVAEGLGHQVRHCEAKHEAISFISDTNSKESFVIVDLDDKSGRRSLLNTAAGTLSVIAISRREKPWLESMLRRRSVGASLVKPVSATALANAINDLREGETSEATIDQRQRSILAAESRFKTDFHRCLRFALCQRVQRRNCPGFCRGHCPPK